MSTEATMIEELKALAEKATPGPYLEMFARRRRLGWFAHGDQIDNAMPLFSTAV